MTVSNVQFWVTGHFAPWLFCPKSFCHTSQVVSSHFLGHFVHVEVVLPHAVREEIIKERGYWSGKLNKKWDYERGVIIEGAY